MKLFNKIITRNLLLTLKMRIYHISTSNFHKTYDHRTWQTGELTRGTTTSKVTWPWDHVVTWSHVTNNSTSPKAVTTKVGKVGIYNKGPPSIKSFDVLSTWSSDHITWLIKNVIFLLPRELWLRNLTEWWVLMRAYHPQSNITGWSCCHIKSYNKWKTL